MARKTIMNSITSPELLAQVNPKNRELLNDFLDYLRSSERSNGTIEQYRSDIQIAFVWNLQNNDNKFFVDWTKRNIVAYQNWLLNNNENSPARVRRMKASLSSMSNYICNILDDDIVFLCVRDVVSCKRFLLVVVLYISLPVFGQSTHNGIVCFFHSFKF